MALFQWFQNLERRGLLTHFHQVLKRDMTSYLLLLVALFDSYGFWAGKWLFTKTVFIDILKLPALAVVILILGTQKV